jgi:hypothetical protein
MDNYVESKFLIAAITKSIAISFIQNVIHYPSLKVKHLDEIIGDHECEYQHNR